MFTCSVCNRSFSNRYYLDKHRSIHMKMSIHSSDICNKDLTEEVSLKARETTSHIDGKLYECSVCKRKFTKKSNLNRHFLIHTGERRFECTTCNRKFRLKHHLFKHQLTHNNDNMHGCNMCRRKFRNLSTLEKHKQSHYFTESSSEAITTGLPDQSDSLMEQTHL